MKKNYLNSGRKLFSLILTCSLIFFTLFAANAQTNTPLRRPISPQQPMWLIHIDTWNLADPQKIIDMVPQDIRPYVVFNISLSINHRGNKWLQVEYGYETAKSWLRTCAENRVWAMIQPSSGAFSHFSDTDLRVYEEFFRDYPNFLGFNYCEQFWGYGDPYGVTYEQRLALWANLMKLNQKYGGYLCVSFTNAFYDADRNPVAMMKRDPNFEAICKSDPEHFIMCEKFTIGSGFHDVESTSLGAYLSGFSGQYGIRFDECGWVGSSRRDKFPVAAGASPVLEHIMLTGETVIDGPETIPVQVCHEIETVTSSEGYTQRQWEFYPQFYNISMDIFRKIIDGTVRILTRKEVIDRTKLVLINDVNIQSQNRDSLRVNYITPETLYDGLYKMDDDGTYLKNRSWFKKTGRYAAIPMVYQLKDATANSFQVNVNKSDYEKRWPSIEAKVNEFNQLFPEEYNGDLFAARSENGWVTYNPFKTGQTAKAAIPFKYNTCDRMELTYSRYTTGIIKEFPNKLTFYLTNYDNANTDLKNDTIKIYGSKSKPTFTFENRIIKRVATDTPAKVASNWTDGVFTLIVTHNGPLDITVNCAGNAKDRLTKFTVAPLVKPGSAPAYSGPFQYEAENFDYKNIEANITNGINKGVANYTAQGYLRFGTNAEASIRKNIKALKSGKHTLTIKYLAPNGKRDLQLLVNGVRSDISFAQTESANDWKLLSQTIQLKKGNNQIEFKANNDSINEILFDNVIVDGDYKKR